MFGIHLSSAPAAQMLKNLPAVQQTQVCSPVQQDPLENEMATHSSILAWGIPWTEEPYGLQSTGWQSREMTEPVILTSAENFTIAFPTTRG